MSTLPAPLPLAPPDGAGPWRWLLRSLGLEAWFRQPAPAAPGSQLERVFLQLAPAPGQPGPEVGWPVLLATALAECQAAIQDTGGEVVSHQSTSLLLSWPAALGSQQAQVVRTYFELCASIDRQTGQRDFTLCGAASLGWVEPRRGRGRYRGGVLAGVAGLLRAGQQLGSGLLISAALHHRLDAGPGYHYALDVAFQVSGHRYPVTVFRVSAGVVGHG